MKQILYFFIGFILSMITLLPFSYSAECLDMSDPSGVEAAIGGSKPHSYIGIFPDGSSAWAALSSVTGTSSGHDNTTFNFNCGVTTVFFRQWDVATYYAIVENPLCVDECAIDSDGDGIPDDEDWWRDDPTQHSVRPTLVYTDDEGNVVGTIYQTTDEENSYICVGQCYGVNDLPDGYNAQIINNGTWTNPVSSSLGAGSPVGNPISDIEGPSINNDGSAPTGSDDSFSDGTDSTGSESDNEALQKIIDNTSRTVDNTKRQGDYLKDINKSIQDLARDIALSDNNSNEEPEENNQDEADAQNGLNNMDNLNVSTYYNDSNFSGALTQGEDYEAAAPLSEQSWFTDFISSNPLKTSFESSGFSVLNPSSSMSLNLGDMGTHQIDLSDFQTGFQTAGNLLLSLTGLLALIIVAWR